MTSNYIIQYTIVCVLILGAIVWIAIKASRKNKKGVCHGCSLADTCARVPKKKTKDCCENGDN